MKKIFFAVIILLSVILISCGDIVDSENNIDKTKITYNSVKSDQEHGVIMPLKVGNKWIYKVTEYNSTGIIQNIYLDSIVVNEETMVNGEKWFKVRFPQIKESNDILMTNTDVGLLYKCDICSEDIALLAQYQLTSKEYFSNSHNNMYLVLDNIGNPINESSIKVLSMVSTQSPVQTMYGIKNYDGIGYNIKDQSEENPKLYTVNTYDYVFVPDYGPFESKIYRNPNEQITYLEKSYSLVNFNKLKDSSMLQSLFVIDFGDVPVSNYKDTTVTLLYNQSNEIISLTEILINDKSGVFNYLNELPVSLLPGEIILSTFGCRPIKIGKYEAIMQVITDKEIFDVILKCNGTK